jgi:hypothetical protein
LRVAVVPSGETVRVTALDGSGVPTLVVDTLTSRPIEAGRLIPRGAGNADGLFVLDWTEVPLASANGSPHRFALLGDVPGVAGHVERHDTLAALVAAMDAGGAVPDVVIAGMPPAPVGDEAQAAHDAVCRTLALVQAFVADDRFAESRLVVVTTGAAAVRQGELPDLAAAAVWGLTRSAAAEYPGRVVSVDLDDAADVAWLPLLGVDEPQLAIRSGHAYAPRLARAGAPASDDPAPAAEGTVLITGGTGGLGALVARRLAERGAGHLLLASRRGPRAEGVEDLVASLAALGAAKQSWSCCGRSPPTAR